MTAFSFEGIKSTKERVSAGLNYVWEMMGERHTLTDAEAEDLRSLREQGADPLQAVIYNDLENYTPATESPTLTWREKLGGFMTRALVTRPFKHLESFAKTKEAMEAYETAHVETRYIDDTDMLWLDFSGLSDGTDPKPFGYPARQMCPQEGVQINFQGPTGIVGMNGEQCCRCTDMVMAQVREEIAKYPNYRIGVFGYSAGTHLSTYVANTIGKEQGQPVEKLINVSTGDSIMYGSHSTPVTQMIAETHENAGKDKYAMTDEIFAYAQKSNLQHLPPGNRTMIIGGSNDRFIPFHAEGGTGDHIDKIKSINPDVGVYIAEGRDHVSIILHLIRLQKEGVDVYNRKGEVRNKVPFLDMPAHIQDLLLEETGSGYSASYPNEIVDQAHALISQQAAQSNAHSLSLQAVRELYEGRRLVEEGFVAARLPQAGLIVSQEVITTDDEAGIDATTLFVQKHATGAQAKKAA